MELLIILKIILLAAALGCIAYFEGSETALMSLSGSTLHSLREQHPAKALYLDYWEKCPNQVLAALLIATNFATIAAGVLATSLALDFPSGSSSLTWLFPAIATLVILVFGEVFPKIYSRFNFEKVALLNITPLVLFAKTLVPVSNLCVSFSERLMRFFGIAQAGETPFITASELHLLLSLAERPAGPAAEPESYDGISYTQRKMLTNILSFVDTKIPQVMKNREKIVAVNIDSPAEDLIEQILSSKFSRIPVYKNSLDNIIGIIYTKDLTISLSNRELLVLQDLIRPAYFVPESALVDNLLREFRKGGQHLAIVVDEYGTTVGLVTIEDLMEEIVGEIYDEYDIHERKSFRMPDGSWTVFGNESLKDLNEKLGSGLEAENVVTINGYILEQIGRIPATGEIFEMEGLQITIIDSGKKKINKLKIVKK